jgi:hypothetical protein
MLLNEQGPVLARTGPCSFFCFKDGIFGCNSLQNWVEKFWGLRSLVSKTRRHGAPALLLVRANWYTGRSLSHPWRKKRATNGAPFVVVVRAKGKKQVLPSASHPIEQNRSPGTP